MLRQNWELETRRLRNLIQSYSHSKKKTNVLKNTIFNYLLPKKNNLGDTAIN